MALVANGAPIDVNRTGLSTREPCLLGGRPRRETYVSKIWVITGANRGFGLEIAKAALGVGDTAVATARKPEQVADVLPAHWCLRES